MGGGNLEAKILEEPKVKIPSATKCGYEEASIGDSVNIAYPNSTTRRGRVGKGVAQTLLTGEEQAVLEPLVWDGYNQAIRKDSDTTGTITCQCGHDLKRNGQGIIEPIALDEQNGYIRNDGTVGSLTTDGSSPKHNNRVVEPKLVGGFGEKKSNGGTQYYQQDRVYDGEDMAMCHPASIPGGSYNYQVDYRVRKLTEKECFRLQGVKDEDFERVRKNQSKSSCYHLAGDSITTSVLMALFGEMLGVDWRSKINELTEDLCK